AGVGVWIVHTAKRNCRLLIVTRGVLHVQRQRRARGDVDGHGYLQVAAAGPLRLDQAAPEDVAVDSGGGQEVVERRAIGEIAGELRIGGRQAVGGDRKRRVVV